jgi:prepilin-type N-terminal cleavage/methylation domain-containing protein
VRTPATQEGFSLIELSAVLVLLTVLAALVWPRVEAYIIEGRVSTAGRDLLKVMSMLKNSAAATPNPIPFASLQAADIMFADTSFNISPGVVQHGLGVATGRIVPTVIGGGSAMAITLWGLHPSACKLLPGTLARLVDSIEVGRAGTSSTPTAPSAPTAVPVALSASVFKTSITGFDAMGAGSACNLDGSNNYVRFYMNG